jgi:hypothetical protein
MKSLKMHVEEFLFPLLSGLATRQTYISDIIVMYPTDLFVGIAASAKT